MAAVEVTISGMLYDKINRTQQNVVLIGEAVLTGLGVGGGPMPPGGGQPPVIDVPKPPVVTHPIWPPSWAGHPLPIPPDPPVDPPVDPPTNPPSPQWVWGFVPSPGGGQGYWSPVYVPRQGVDPGPKK